MGKNLDDLNSACCRIKGSILTAQGIQKGHFPELIGGHAVVEGTSIPLTELADKLRPLLEALLPPMLRELRELQEEAKNSRVG